MTCRQKANPTQAIRHIPAQRAYIVQSVHISGDLNTSAGRPFVITEIRGRGAIPLLHDLNTVHRNANASELRDQNRCRGHVNKTHPQPITAFIGIKARYRSPWDWESRSNFAVPRDKRREPILRRLDHDARVSLDGEGVSRRISHPPPGEMTACQCLGDTSAGHIRQEHDEAAMVVEVAPAEFRQLGLEPKQVVLRAALGPTSHCGHHFPVGSHLTSLLKNRGQ